MDYSLVPSFPPPPFRSDGPPQHTRRRTPRQRQVFVDLVCLAGIVVLLFGTRYAVTAIQQAEAAELVRASTPPPQPLQFETVAERFARVHVLMPDAEVHALLGPQPHTTLQEPEMDEHDRLVRAHPDRYPGRHYWAKWADPRDPSRWVAVFFSGGLVYKMLKHGV